MRQLSPRALSVTSDDDGEQARARALFDIALYYTR
jgi:hypothetical protein